LSNTIAKQHEELVFGPIVAHHIGGSGYDSIQKQSFHLGLKSNALVVIDKNSDLTLTEIPFSEISELEISGPGTVTTNAGVSGGGFGLAGFLTGAAAATVINSVTAKTSTNTFVRIMTPSGEIYIHTSEIEPDALRMGLSPIFVNLSNRSKIPAHTGVRLSEELLGLQKLFNDGALSQEEFDAAKKKILT
jgi:hypothetical protein